MAWMLLPLVGKFEFETSPENKGLITDKPPGSMLTLVAFVTITNSKTMLSVARAPRG
jgi:hypothetical protein